MILDERLNEITESEMMDTEGGVLLELGVGLAVVTAIAVAGNDLNNCYKNGYNEVMCSVSGGDAK